jgi:hypothetical protein
LIGFGVWLGVCTFPRTAAKPATIAGTNGQRPTANGQRPTANGQRPTANGHKLQQRLRVPPSLSVPFSRRPEAGGGGEAPSREGPHRGQEGEDQVPPLWCYCYCYCTRGVTALHWCDLQLLRTNPPTSACQRRTTRLLTLSTPVHVG